MWPFTKPKRVTVADMRRVVQEELNLHAHRMVDHLTIVTDCIGAVRTRIEKGFTTMKEQIAALRQALDNINSALTSEIGQIQEKLDALQSAIDNEADAAEMTQLIADANAIAARIKNIVPDSTPDVPVEPEPQPEPGPAEPPTES